MTGELEFGGVLIRLNGGTVAPSWVTGSGLSAAVGHSELPAVFREKCGL